MEPPTSSGPGYPVPPPPPPQAYAAAPPPLASFSLGDILGQTFAIYGANFVAFAMIMTVVSLPAIAATILMGSNPLAAVVPTLLGFLTGPMATAAITYGVYEYLSGRPTTVGDCLRVGFANILPVLGVAILTGLIIMGGMILCFVPGLIAMTVYAVAVPVAVEERIGGMDALRRSSSLTEGHRWEIFAILFIIGMIGSGAGFIVGMAFGILGKAEQARLVGQLLGIVIGGLSATAPALMYYRLRSLKESVDVRSIASVFD